MAGLAVLKADGFGAQDLLTFSFCSVPIALVCGWIAQRRFIQYSRGAIGIAGKIVTGVIVAYVSVVLLSTLGGPWFAVLSVPVLANWIAASVVALITFAEWPVSLTRSFLGLAAAIALMIGVEVATSAFLGQQQLWITVLELSPGPSEGGLAIEATESINPSDRDLVLRQLEPSLRGTLRVRQSGWTGLGPQARVILVFTGAPFEDVRLRQPDRSTIVYVQSPTGKWSHLPPDPRLLRRELRLYRAVDNGQPMYSVEDCCGGSVGGGLHLLTRQLERRHHAE